MDHIGLAPGESGTDWDERIRVLVPRVYRYFCYRVGDGRMAEDLTGDTFERAWRSRDRYRTDRGDWGQWVLGIARHVAADFFRRRKRTDETAVSSEGPLGRPTEDDCDRRSDFARIGTLVSRLAERDRELVALKYGAELTNRTIAEMTGLTESNVGTILHRIVSALRREWEEEP
jgi:RNA polymerase sigma-70 factor (ECF subfamily)